MSETLDASTDRRYWEKHRRPVLNSVSEIFSYPPPPVELYIRVGCRLPRTSGVYFHYDSGGVCTYVGKSVNMGKRSHPHNEDNCLVAYIEFAADDLDYAECYYIGLLKPRNNFKPDKRSWGYEKSVAVLEKVCQ